MKTITLYGLVLLVGLFWCVMVILGHRNHVQRFTIEEQRRLLDTATAQLQEAAKVVHKTHAQRP